MTLSGLPDWLGQFPLHIALALDHILGEMLGRDGQRRGRRHMHGELLGQRRELGLVGGGFQRHQHADLAQFGRGRIMDIGRDHAGIDRSATVRRTLIFSPILATSSVSVCCTVRAPCLAASSFSRSPPSFSARSRGRFDEALELLVAGDEIGFGIDLDQRARAVAHGDAHQTFGGGAAGLLGGLGNALLAQPVDGGFHVAVGFAQRGLQSIMPAPVLSRRSFTMLAVMFAMSVSIQDSRG